MKSEGATSSSSNNNNNDIENTGSAPPTPRQELFHQRILDATIRHGARPALVMVFENYFEKILLRANCVVKIFVVKVVKKFFTSDWKPQKISKFQKSDKIPKLRRMRRPVKASTSPRSVTEVWRWRESWSRSTVCRRVTSSCAICATTFIIPSFSSRRR